MYYQNYDDYMRDVFYFNQMPTQNMNSMYMGYNIPNSNFQANGNPNFNNGNSNINNMYPSIYRIVQPVVSRVVTGNNYGYMSEDNLNSMVDTVYNIVEGDVMNDSGEEDSTMNNSSTQTQTQTQRNNNQNTTQTTSTTQTNTTSRVNDNMQHSRNLLRDLIKILLIKEILNRNNIRRFSNNGFNNFQSFPNYYDQRYMF